MLFSLCIYNWQPPYVAVMFLLHGQDSKWLSADWSACSFSPRLCWTGLTAWRGEKARPVSFVPKLQRGSHSLPRLFQLKESAFTSNLPANLHIRHRPRCLAPRQVVEDEEEGGGCERQKTPAIKNRVLRGDVQPLASTLKVPCLKSCLHIFSLLYHFLMGSKAIKGVFTANPISSHSVLTFGQSACLPSYAETDGVSIYILSLWVEWNVLGVFCFAQLKQKKPGKTSPSLKSEK